MLQRGDQYVLRAGQLICRTDFEKELYMMQVFVFSVFSTTGALVVITVYRVSTPSATPSPEVLNSTDSVNHVNSVNQVNSVKHVNRVNP